MLMKRSVPLLIQMSAKVERPHLVLDFSEALKDSPAFRQDLQEHYEYFTKIQKRYEESTRLVDVIVEQGQNYVAAMYNLTAALNCLWSDMGIDEPSAKTTFDAMSEALGQVVHLNRNLIETTFPALRSDLEMFNKNELSKLKVAKVQFDTMSNNIQDALAKRASISRNCSQALKEARNSLTAVGTCFAHQSLDYVAQINIAHARKHHVFLDALFHCYNDFSTHFKKGHLYFCEQPDQAIMNATECINALKNKSKLVERKMQDRHSIVSKDLFEMHSGIPTDPFVSMEGYLFKRSSKTFKMWQRRWFMIKGEKFMYIKKNGESLQSIVMEENLKLCLVRPAPLNVERSSCFELVSRNGSHLLQADSDMLCCEWMHAIQATIQHLHESDNDQKSNKQLPFLKNLEASSTSSFSQGSGRGSLQNINDINGSNRLQSSMNSKSNAKSGGTPRTTAGVLENSVSFFEEIRQIPGNRNCADCGNSDAKWASINLGVVICIECSGAHRSLGVHVSKVRSLTMDDLSENQKGVLLALGNHKVNAIYLACRHEVTGASFPTQLFPNSERAIREQYITAKYVDRKFAKPLINKALNNISGGVHKSSSFHDNLGLLDSTHQTNGSRHSAGLKPVSSTSNLEATASSLRASIQNALAATSSETCLHDVGEIAIEQQAKTALQEGDLAIIMRLMVSGFDINSRINTTYPLHIAVENNHPVLVEFLFLNGAMADVVDEQLNTPLHIASERGFTLIVYQLVKRNVDKSIKNAHNETALDLAVNAQHANIVTLLRLQELYDENNDGENALDRFIDDLHWSKQTESAQQLNNSSDN